MDKCKHCRKKKGKRNCPALAGAICTLCCGKHRRNGIDCPGHCTFLGGDADYNQKKQVDHFSQKYMYFGRNLIRKYSEDAADLLYMLDASTLVYYLKSGETLKDMDIIKGWEYILDRSSSALVVPGEEISPFADFLINRGNGAVQKLIGEKEEMKGPIREYVQFIKDFSTNTDESTEYVTVHEKYLESISSPEEMKMVVEEYYSPAAADKSITL